MAEEEKKTAVSKTKRAPAKKAAATKKTAASKKTPQKSKSAAAEKPVPESKSIPETACAPACCCKAAKGGIGAIATLIGIILVFGVLLVYINMSRFSKSVVEQVTSNALGVPVTIEEMLVELKDMRVTVTGLKIANPAGFEEPYAMISDAIVIEGESFSREKLVFNKMAFTGTSVYLETNGRDTNLSVLGGNLTKGQESEAKESDADEAEEKAKAKASQPGIVVRDLRIENARLVPSPELVELGAEEVLLPPISGSVGSDGEGVTPDRAISEVTGIILDTAVKRAVRSRILKSVQGADSGSIADKLGIGSDTVESLKEGLKNFFE